MAITIKRKTRAVEEIPLASTADIAFLLIVFFLAASALLELRGIQIPLPKKDAPPMQVLTKNLFKIYIDGKGSFVYEKNGIELDALQIKMREAFRANSELIISVRVDAEAPIEKVPELVQRVQQEGIERISIGMDKAGGR